MDSAKTKKPVHLTCPKCRYEFEYDHAGVDAKIRRLGMEITDILSQFRQKRAQLGEGTAEYREWQVRASAVLRAKQREHAELKDFRKVANQQEKATELQVFAQIVRENVTQQQYEDWHRQAEKLLAYNTYDTAIQRHNNFANA